MSNTPTQTKQSWFKKTVSDQWAKFKNEYNTRPVATIAIFLGAAYFLLGNLTPAVWRIIILLCMVCWHAFLINISKRSIAQYILQNAAGQIMIVVMIFFLLGTITQPVSRTDLAITFLTVLVMVYAQYVWWKGMLKITKRLSSHTKRVQNRFKRQIAILSERKREPEDSPAPPLERDGLP